MRPTAKRRESERYCERAEHPLAVRAKVAATNSAERDESRAAPHDRHHAETDMSHQSAKRDGGQDHRS